MMVIGWIFAYLVVGYAYAIANKHGDDILTGFFIVAWPILFVADLFTIILRLGAQR